MLPPMPPTAPYSAALAAGNPAPLADGRHTC